VTEGTPSRRRSEQPFDDLAATWWNESGILHGLGVVLDPVRLPFVTGVLQDELDSDSCELLDLGAGGGVLAEALAGRGHSVTALDPSLPSVQAGRAHGGAAGSGVRYLGGRGEQLPFPDRSFDAVVCMEVLEHVDEPAAVVAEVARVLRPGGVFIFSGPNRTVRSGLALVAIAQNLLGLIPRGTHRWNRLVRPDEMDRFMRHSGIEPVRVLGVGLRVRSLPRAAVAVVGLLFGRFTHSEAATRIRLVAGTGTGFAYQGFGRRRHH
jgi:2-polyprenyl-6-hydroxyphenyl methylase/3-demethylubiquinone-9 3-methyltransferase